MIYKGYEILAKQIEEFFIDDDGEIGRETGNIILVYFTPELDEEVFYDLDDIKEAIDELKETKKCDH